MRRVRHDYGGMDAMETEGFAPLNRRSGEEENEDRNVWT